MVWKNDGFIIGLDDGLEMELIDDCGRQARSWLTPATCVLVVLVGGLSSGGNTPRASRLNYAAGAE